MATTNVTKQKQAKTNTDVNKQDARTRLWQSFNTTYNDAIKQSNKAYQQNYVDADLQAQSRGMGRSSYNNQTLANINTEKANAANRLNSEKIAAYQQALNSLEQQEQEQANWEAQMAMQYIGNILATNGNASDALLKQAGLSRQDFNAMRQQQAVGGGGGGRYSRKNDNGDVDNTNPTLSPYDQFILQTKVGLSPSNLNSFETSTTTTNKNNYYDPRRPHYINK